jgi:hypothetical protein
MNTKGITTLKAVVSMVIVAVLILFAIFMMRDRFGLFDSNLKSCSTKGGICVASVAECEGIPSSFNCPGEKQVCCMVT